MSVFKYASIAVFPLLLNLSGCVNLPEVKNTEFEEDVVVESGDALLETPVATKTDEETEQTAEQEQDAYLAQEKSYETFDTASGYWKNALKHMQHGNEEEAQWALQQALKLNPNSNIAKKLLHQIEVDAINEFGIVNFEYQVQYGDSLSAIAKRYLEDPLLFYLLAKYNQISNPSHLVVGQYINIPGAKPVIPVAEPEPVAPVANQLPAVDETTEMSVAESSSNVGPKADGDNEIAERAKAYFLESNYDGVIDLLEDSPLVEKGEPVAKNLLVRSYFENAKMFNKEGNVHEAKYLLLRAAELEPDNPQVNMALIDMDESMEIEGLYQQGIKALQAGKIERAHELISQVLKHNPYHKRALEKLDVIKARLLPHYYKTALMAQRKHELDKAINLWDSVLALDSTNENAKIYRNKAINLKMKLEKLAQE